MTINTRRYIAAVRVEHARKRNPLKLRQRFALWADDYAGVSIVATILAVPAAGTLLAIAIALKEWLVTHK